MGKRELLIISVFLLVGIAAYQLTAPPSTEPSRRLTLSNFANAFRRGGRAARASATQSGTLAVASGISELRIGAIGQVEVIGETRSDITYELTVDASGPNEEIARGAADRTTLTKDEIGPVLAIRTSTPTNGRSPTNTRQTARAVLRVPKALAVRVDAVPGPMAITISQVARVHLEGVVGDVRLRQIAGSVSGTHRNGDLRVEQAGSLTMTLVSSKALLDQVNGPIALNARNGQCRMTRPGGPIDVEGTDEELTVADAIGEIRVRGTGGVVTIDRPGKDVTVDVRRTRIDVLLDRSVSLTALTAEAPLRLVFTTEPHAEIEAAATEGDVHADDFSLTAETRDGASRLQHTFEPATSRVTLRNHRGEIVIARMK